MNEVFKIHLTHLEGFLTYYSVGALKRNKWLSSSRLFSPLRIYFPPLCYYEEENSTLKCLLLFDRTDDLLKTLPALRFVLPTLQNARDLCRKRNKRRHRKCRCKKGGKLVFISLHFIGVVSSFAVVFYPAK